MSTLDNDEGHCGPASKYRAALSKLHAAQVELNQLQFSCFEIDTKIVEYVRLEARCDTLTLEEKRHWLDHFRTQPTLVYFFATASVLILEDFKEVLKSCLLFMCDAKESILLKMRCQMVTIQGCVSELEIILSS